MLCNLAICRKDIPLRIIFMGSPDFAVGTLQALTDAGHDIVCVYAQPPRPTGRGHKEKPCPVHASAMERGLVVRTPESMKDARAIAEFVDLSAEVAVVVAYGQILPDAVLNAPRYGCINVHASLLPRWRGAAPIQRAIQAGDGQSGVSIMQMASGLDTGPVFLTRTVDIGPETTGGHLHDELASLGAAACVEVLHTIEQGTAVAVAQAEGGVTYAQKLNTTESQLNWAEDAAVLERTIRAFDPWPRTWFEYEGERIKVLAGHVADEPSSKTPGTILDTSPSIACGSGALVLDRLQRAGRRAQDSAEFMRGFDMKVGSCLVSD